MKKRLFIILTLIMALSVMVIPVSAQELPPVEDEEQNNPVITYLAEVFEMSYEEIIAYQEGGFGLGEIANAAYFLSLSGEGTLLEIMTSAQDLGWGELYQSIGETPNQKEGLGELIREMVHQRNEIKQEEKLQENNGGKPETTGKPESTSPPEHANNDKDK